MNPLLVLLLGAGAIGGMLWFAGSSPDKPLPSPDDSGPPPPPNQDLLRQRVQELLAQALANPGSLTNPASLAAMDQLAAELDAAGMPVEAAQVRATAAQLRMLPPIATMPGEPNVPLGPLPTMDPTLANQMNAILANARAGITNPAIVSNLADRIAATYPGFFQPEIQRLRALAASLPPV